MSEQELQWGPEQEDGTVMCVPPHTADGSDRGEFPDPAIFVTPPEPCPDLGRPVEEIPGLESPIATHPPETEEGELAPPQDVFPGPRELAETGPGLDLVLLSLSIVAGIALGMFLQWLGKKRSNSSERV